MSVPEAFPDPAVHGVVEHRVAEESYVALLLGEVHPGPLSRTTAFLQRRKDGVYGPHAGARVRICPCRANGRAVGEAGHVGEPGHTLQRLSEADIVPVRPRLAEGRHAHHDQIGADLYQVIIFQVQVAHDAGAVVLYYDVGNGDELEEQVSAALSLEVQGYAVLVAVAHVEVGAAVMGVLGVFYAVGGEHVPDGVHVDCGLYAYDFSAEGGHQLGGIGPGPVAGQVNYPNVSQRQSFDINLHG